MHRPILPALSLLLVACTATGQDDESASKSDGPIEANAAVQTPAFRPPRPAGDISPLSPEHAALLDLMRDPQFPERFAQTWLSETDIEPRLGQLDIEPYQLFMQAMADEHLELAGQILAEQRGPEGNALFDMSAGNLYFTAEDFESAAEAYEAAVVKFPKFRRAWLNLGLTHARLGNLDETVAAISRVIALGGGDAQTYGVLGIAHSGQQDYLAAESAFRMATLLDPASRDWRMGLTECLFKQERFADAVAMCEGLLRSEPERGELWMLQANAYARMGQARRAAENLEVLHGLGKGTTDTHNLLGDIYTNERLFELARDNYLAALRAAPDRGGPRAVRAASDLAARGALDESRELIEGVESIATAGIDEDQRMQLLKLRARIAAASGASEEQVRILEQIVEADPLDGEALLLLGQHHFRAADYDRATLYFDRALGMEQHEAEAARGKAQVLARQQRYAEALPLLRRSQALDPRDSVQEFLEQIERIATTR